MDAATLAGDFLKEEARKAAAAIRLPCKFAGDRFIPPARGPFAEFWTRAGSTVPRRTREGWIVQCTTGIFQFTLYALESGDAQTAFVAANNLRKAFDNKRWTLNEDVRITTDSVRTNALRHYSYGRQIMIVDGGFKVWMRN